MNINISKGGEHRSERNEITSSQLTDTGEFILRYSLFGIAGGQEVDRNFS